jgi:hypothetical protein
METQVVAKNMIKAVVDWGQKMAARPKTWSGNVLVVGLGLNFISLLPKTHCEFSLFFLQWLLCICFCTNKIKCFYKKNKTLHCEFLLQKVGKGLRQACKAPYPSSHKLFLTSNNLLLLDHLLAIRISKHNLEFSHI